MVMNISCKFEKGSYNIFFIKCENISKKAKNDPRSGTLAVSG